MDETARDRIIKAVAGDPTLTVRQLADMVGVTRQRVHQVLQAAGLTVRRALPAIRERPPKPPAPRIVPSVAGGRVNHTVCGTISELIVAADLLARGWEVFFPLVRTTRCDLIAVSAAGTLRIEVRSAVKRETGTLKFEAKDTGGYRLGRDFEHYALVATSSPVEYRPDLPAAEKWGKSAA